MKLCKDCKHHNPPGLGYSYHVCGYYVEVICGTPAYSCDAMRQNAANANTPHGPRCGFQEPKFWEAK